MPSRKPIVQIVLNSKYYTKLKKLAEDEERSLSNQGQRIIEKYIDEYESKHGEIELEAPEQEEEE